MFTARQAPVARVIEQLLLGMKEGTTGMIQLSTRLRTGSMLLDLQQQVLECEMVAQALDTAPMCKILGVEGFSTFAEGLQAQDSGRSVEWFLCTEQRHHVVVGDTVISKHQPTVQLVKALIDVCAFWAQQMKDNG